MIRVALATAESIPALTRDDRLLVPALRALGVHAEPVVWSAAGAMWTTYDAVVVRSCWDYHLRYPAFLDWIDTLERTGVRLGNPPAVLRWSADKRYLRQLAADGVPVVPTYWVEPPTTTSLAQILAATGWDQAVVKPAVSASAYGTWRTSRADAASHEAQFRALGARGSLLVQPFIDQARVGEWSLVFVRGRFSHAVLKSAPPGEFRVQEEFGGRVQVAVPDTATVRSAREALGGVPGDWLYARVDGCLIEGRFVLMELEMVEPALFLAHGAGAEARLAEAIADLVEPSCENADASLLADAESTEIRQRSFVDAAEGPCLPL